MVKYQLVYFNVQGRAEITRLLFAQAGVDYEDKRLTMDEWKDFKQSTPTGQLPMLVIDEKVQIPQSMVIARYLAREFSLYGSDNIEAAQIDALREYVFEFMELGVPVKWPKDGITEAVQTAAETAFREKAKTVFGILDKALKKSSSGFFVGDKVSLIDIYVFWALPYYKGLDVFDEVKTELEKYDKLLKHHQKIADLPRIKEWIKNRPQTDV